MLTKAAIVSLIIGYSNIMGVDPQIAVAVATVESNLNPSAIGSKGEIGLFQLMPQYVPAFTKADLLNPHINILAGVARLKEEKEKCFHKNGLTYLVCYNAGRTKAKAIRMPAAFPYVIKVQKEVKRRTKKW